VSFGGAFALSIGLVGLVVLALTLWHGHTQRKGAFKVIDGMPRTAQGVFYLQRWTDAAISEGATFEQAETIARYVMRKWGQEPVRIYRTNEGPEGDARALARLVLAEQPLEAEHEPGRSGDEHQGE